MTQVWGGDSKGGDPQLFQDRKQSNRNEWALMARLGMYNLAMAPGAGKSISCSGKGGLVR